MDNRSYYLYKITNLINGKLYIGVTAHPKKRVRQHLFEKPKIGKISLIKNAAIKYGGDNFKFEVICIGKKDYIYDLEVKAIKAYSTTSPNGYNIAIGGEGGNIGKVEKRSDDYVCYVSGFWFPNKRVACKALQIETSNIFYTWRMLGILGDEVKPRKNSKYPIYYKGFWFDSVKTASAIYNKSTGSITQQVYRGKVEENASLVSFQPNRTVFVDGVAYKDVKEASNLLGIPYSTLIDRIYKNKLGYSYEN